jgi:hypothetical protein
VEIFYGNRSPEEIIMITTQPFDCMLAEGNAIPIEPYMGDEYDMTLYQLE